MSVVHHQREMPAAPTDFGTVQGLLRTRLYSTESAGADVVRRVVAPGLMQRVLIDQGGTALPVTYDLLRRWPITEFDLFALAERNVRATDDLRVDMHEVLDPGLPPLALLTGAEYLTAHVRWLGEQPVLGPEGAVLTLPSQRAVFVYPVVGPEIVSSAQVLAQFAAESFAKEPALINPWVYWWHRGRLDLAATVRNGDDGPQLYPTSQFADFVTRLGGDASWGA